MCTHKRTHAHTYTHTYTPADDVAHRDEAKRPAVNHLHIKGSMACTVEPSRCLHVVDCHAIKWRMSYMHNMRTEVDNFKSFEENSFFVFNACDQLAAFATLPDHMQCNGCLALP